MLGSLDISQLLGDGDDASGLPSTGYSEEEGFTWVDTLRSVDCDSSDRKALCVEDRTATMVTAQVLTSQDTCVLKLRLSGNGHQLAFGIVDENPSGFSRLAIGDERLQSSIGAMCSPISGTIVYEGRTAGEAPAVKNGDIVEIRTSEGGRVEFLKGSSKFHSIKVGGKCKFRLAVTLFKQGQQVEILRGSGGGGSLPAGAAGALQVVGAGLPAVNGSYTATGTYNGKPMYKKEDGAILYWKNMWKLNDSDNTGGWWYERDDTSATGAWETAAGLGWVDPAPVVKAASGSPAEEDASIISPKSAAAVSTSVPVTAAAAPALPVEARRTNRWGDGLDAAASGHRDFFPKGWTPAKTVREAVEARTKATSL
ncbi:unnamed protein product [Effrenium voratum]|uniref:Uncharacterized protein n=1 Tax=Effrenium voratum TaxID=2562239 RepID=A0AA36IKL1_9DINO|nr:unnamed protein product [Effrenium voratum]